MGHVVHRELAEIFPLLDSLRKDAGGGAVGHAHAVADEENDVFATRGPVANTGPGDFTAPRAVARYDLVAAGLIDAGLAQYH